MRHRAPVGVTLVELVIVLVVSGILFVATPPLMFQGVQTMVFLPKALAVNEAAMEAMHQMVEGGFSTLTGQTAPVRGLRFAVRRSSTEPALWRTQATNVGFLTSDNQCVFIQLVGGVIRRSVFAPPCSACSTLPCSTEEDLPYQAPGNVQISASPSLFQYYNQAGGTTPPYRRVDITLTARTGSGLFDEGQASENLTTSVAIRIP